MRKTRLVGLGATLLLGGTLGSLPACGEAKSGLMLAIVTDMKAPKDVNAVGVTVSTNNSIKHNVIGRVTPQGDILLPATLAIVQPDDPNASIRIRVMAFQDRRARVLRDVRTSIPSGGRISLLRIPLTFVNDGSVIGELPPNVVPPPNEGTETSVSGGTSSDGGASSKDGGLSSSDASSGGPGTASGSAGSGGSSGGVVGTSDAYDPTAFVPNCPNPEHTWIDGECQDAYIDPNSLPEFDEKLVGHGDEPGVCFDVKTCFASAIAFGGSASNGGSDGNGGPSTATSDAGAKVGGDTPPAGVDAGRIGGQNIKLTNISFDLNACSVLLDPGTDASRLNLAIVTPDTGECIRPGECYVPVDSGPGGWTAENGQIKLPSFVCKLVKGKNLSLRYAIGCASKRQENPVCAETTVQPSDNRPPVSGGEAGTIGPTDKAQLIIPEEGASSIAIDGTGTLYLAGSKRIARADVQHNAVGAAAAQLQIPASASPWVFGYAPRNQSGFILTNGTTDAYYAATPDPAVQPTKVSVPASAKILGSAFVPGFGYVLGVSGAEVGGVYGVSGTTANRLTPTNFPTDVSVVGAYPGGLVYGTPSGLFAGCMGSGCATPTQIGNGRVYALAGNPLQNNVGYAIVGEQVVRGVGDSAGNLIQKATLVPSGVTPASIGGIEYPRAIAADGRCVVFSAPDGLHVMPESGGAARVMYPATTDKPVLGVALRPDGVYFTVFGPLSAPDAGVWYAPLPPECGGTVSSGNDAGMCQPMTCADVPAGKCGAMPNGCGGTLNCPCGVDASVTCFTCAQMGACGPVTNNCGQPLNCGPCGGDAGTGDGGACTPFTCAQLGCGNHPNNGCGFPVSCAPCLDAGADAVACMQCGAGVQCCGGLACAANPDGGALMICK